MKIKSSVVLFSLMVMTQSYAADLLNLTKFKATPTQRQSLCKQVPSSCNDQNWQLYQVQQQAQSFYAISGLKLYQFNQNNKSLALINQWDFSKAEPKSVTTHWTTDEDPGISDIRHLYPALFKISEQNYAIALIQSFRESYAGGAMTEEVADFFELQTDRRYQLQFSNIPFSVSRLIRACFSAEQYERAGDEHCHDEESLVLNIRYQKPYQWQMKYHYYRRLSPVSDQRPVNQRRNYILNQTNKTIKFPASWTEY